MGSDGSFSFTNTVSVAWATGEDVAPANITVKRTIRFELTKADRYLDMLFDNTYKPLTKDAITYQDLTFDNTYRILTFDNARRLLDR